MRQPLARLLSASVLVLLCACTATTRVLLTPEQSLRLEGRAPTLRVVPLESPAPPDAPRRELTLAVSSVEARYGPNWRTFPASVLEDDDRPWMSNRPANEVALVVRQASECANRTIASFTILGTLAGAVGSYFLLKPAQNNDGLEGLSFLFLPPLTIAASGLSMLLGTQVAHQQCDEEWRAVEVVDGGAAR